MSTPDAKRRLSSIRANVLLIACLCQISVCVVPDRPPYRPAEGEWRFMPQGATQQAHINASYRLGAEPQQVNDALCFRILTKGLRLLIPAEN
jgi:hypothetical protein